MEKQEMLKKFELKSGGHKSIDEGACVMEMVSYLANEPWSDHPKCACPVLTGYAIRINDKFADADRQKLKPLITKLIGTRSTDAIQIKRKQLIMWRNVTATFPFVLDLIKLPELAEKLRAFANTVDDMKLAAKFLNENREVIRKNAYAYADADAYANAYAYADAYANAYADAYADAYAIKAKLADICVETLRMACEIKTEEIEKK